METGSEEGLDTQATSETREVTADEIGNQVTAPKLLKANRKSIEEMLKSEEIDRVVLKLKRFRAADVKEMMRDEYPDVDLNGASAMDMTKRELLDCLCNFYKNERQEEE